jgi:hypothetical protein
MFLPTHVDLLKTLIFLPCVSNFFITPHNNMFLPIIFNLGTSKYKRKNNTAENYVSNERPDILEELDILHLGPGTQVHVQELFEVTVNLRTQIYF